ncbi:hypothetical protein AC478_02880 [miscellaneous Crenarchaeota group-1 archaeon SG8-32-3]|uniref:Uncharacterized protein n=1 Tax=miscellaneous Crenarchaeota group-1 archaeon SG8-32-3 TaxID=1685125 RepID=A0A0M0BSN2_9ARCH|nr:MAG: hypothetical protein AC478_02880 [miscellaneous Crenarchaeota group-1 archaeon SG8-32-3]
MTKQSDETALKYDLTVEEPKNLVEDNVLAVCDSQAIPELKTNLGITSIKTGIKSKKIWLKKMMPDLYNLEDDFDSDKPVKIELDLDLYQMEQV